MYDEQKTEKLVCGSVQEWYSFKNAICEHMSCSTSRSGGQFHAKALQHMLMEKQRNARNVSVNVNVVSGGIEVCKMKSAATHFETLMSFLSFCKADVGNIGHSRYDIVFASLQATTYNRVLL